MIKGLEILQIIEGTEGEIWGSRVEQLGKVKSSTGMRVRMMMMTEEAWALVVTD